MGDLRDKHGPSRHRGNDTHEPAIVTAALDPSKIPQALKDELGELYVVRAQCRVCDDSNLYVAPPLDTTEAECKNDACSASLLFDR